MNPVRRRLRKIAWLALVAMCGVAFGPTISRSLSVASGGEAALHSECPDGGAPMHMAGMARPGSPSGDHPAPGHSSNLLDCCALCAVASSPFTAIAFRLPAFAPQALGTLAPAGDAHASAELLEPWPSAAPRGPPELS